MRIVLLALLLAGCATEPKIVHLTWVKVPGLASKVEVQRNGTDCVILTDDGYVSFAHVGAALRKCVE